ncbi:MAG: hypothetical protein KDD40_07125 [Bdellovibrionales bacterium]|nr:hypothetical protein [Bdellovibrionales bacterium]
MSQNEKNSDGSTAQLSSFDVNTYKLNKLVCDPMGGTGQTDLAKGVKAEVYDANGADLNSVQDYFDQGTKLDVDLFYSTLNVPTRLFNLGFPTQTGETVKNTCGEDLIEYFALKFKTVLKLDDSDLPGLYEFAILSDDGAIVRYKNSQGVFQELINNDGDHPTRLGCSTIVVEMDHNKEIPIEIDYYQGPRYHISLVPLWRKIEGERETEPLCGQQGNSLFFDFNNNSKPQKAYQDLMHRKWRVWGAGNLHIPKEVAFNPCVENEQPTISDLQVNNNLDGPLIVTWHTDMIATAQLRIVNTKTGEERVTDSDNVLRTDHSITVLDLEPGTTYTVQAIAISQNYGKSISEEVTVVR